MVALAGRDFADHFTVCSDPYERPDADTVEFRLTYSGLLFASGNKDTKTSHKHAIRRAFHPQLRRLWEVTNGLRSMLDPFPHMIAVGDPYRERLASLPGRFSCGEYKIIPVVTEDLRLICGVDILMLRPDAPGSLIQSGDVDGRLKTLFDALKRPDDAKQLAGAKPTEEEVPFYCLLEDDKMISQLTVQTDLLLEAVEAGRVIDPNSVRLVITVRLRPSDL